MSQENLAHQASFGLPPPAPREPNPICGSHREHEELHLIHGSQARSRIRLGIGLAISGPRVDASTVISCPPLYQGAVSWRTLSNRSVSTSLYEGPSSSWPEYFWQPGSPEREPGRRALRIRYRPSLDHIVCKRERSPSGRTRWSSRGSAPRMQLTRLRPGGLSPLFDALAAIE